MIKIETENFYTKIIYIDENCIKGEHKVIFFNSDSDEEFQMNHEEIKETLIDYKAKSQFVCESQR
jgi:hypothetical protein